MNTSVHEEKNFQNKPHKSMYGLYKKIKNISITVDLQMKLVDSLVAPVLLYTSEIWSFENENYIARAHLQFCKSMFLKFVILLQTFECMDNLVDFHWRLL